MHTYITIQHVIFIVLQIGELDAIIVPGFGFDSHCHRIGKGGGYYDAFFSRFVIDAKEMSLKYPITLVSDI